MRENILYLIVAALAVYAWRDWFISVCALIVLSALSKHPDMPRMLWDMNGANPLNILLATVVVAWVVTRKTGSFARPCSRYVVVVCTLYTVVLVVSFLRAFVDTESLRRMAWAMPTRFIFATECLVNPLKYLVLALMVFDGARTRRNLLLGYGAVIAQVLVFVVLTIRYIPLECLFEHAGSRHGEILYRYRFQKFIGFHANDLALVLVAGFWALAASVPLLRMRRWWWKAGAVVAGTMIALSIALTNSRAGYLAFVGVGVLFGVLRYRWLVVVLPLALLLVLLVFPSVVDRISLGLGSVDASGAEATDWDEVSAGRVTVLWPPTIDEICNAPVAGQGRLAIWRTSLYERFKEPDGSCTGHPHNAYLEMLLDSGAIGLVITLLCFVGFPALAYARRHEEDGLLATILYAGLAGAGTILIMGTSGQTFWPREGTNTIFWIYALMMAGSVWHCPLPERRAARFVADSHCVVLPCSHGRRQPRAG
jgi:O-antigen ligase